MLLIGLQCVIVAFPGHTHVLNVYSRVKIVCVVINFRNEYYWILRTKMVSVSMLLSLDVYPKTLVLAVILLPVLQGRMLRAERLYPCLPLVYRFVEVVIHRTILYQMFLIAEGLVTVKRVEVRYFAYG